MTTIFKVGDVVKVRQNIQLSFFPPTFIVLRTYENRYGEQIILLNSGARYHAGCLELIPREPKDEFSDLDLSLDI